MHRYAPVVNHALFLLLLTDCFCFSGCVCGWCDAMPCHAIVCCAHAHPPSSSGPRSSMSPGPAPAPDPGRTLVDVTRHQPLHNRPFHVIMACPRKYPESNLTTHEKQPMRSKPTLQTWGCRDQQRLSLDPPISRASSLTLFSQLSMWLRDEGRLRVHLPCACV